MREYVSTSRIKSSFVLRQPLLVKHLKYNWQKIAEVIKNSTLVEQLYRSLYSELPKMINRENKQNKESYPNYLRQIEIFSWSA